MNCLFHHSVINRLSSKKVPSYLLIGMKLLLLLHILTLSLVSDAAGPYKVLVYNVKFAHSHSNIIGRIGDIIAEAGHNVVSGNFLDFFISPCRPLLFLWFNRNSETDRARVR